MRGSDFNRMSVLNNEWAVGLVMIAVLATVGIGAWWVRSYFEASTYSRLTGKHVTTWDAMFVDLRVQEEVKH